MISFNNKKYYVKGTCQAQLADPCTGTIVYTSNKFQTGNITTSVTMGEIRAGLGNAVAAILPSDSALNVEFNAADFSLYVKAAQLGAPFSYGAPEPVCEVITASGSVVTVDTTHGAPVAPLGFSSPICYVQTVGTESRLTAETGAPYAIGSNGTITDLHASTGVQYKVWYFRNSVTAQKVSISSIFDPKVLHFTAQMPVFSNDACTQSTEGTRVGWLYVIVPRLKLGANGGVVGDQTTPDTTSVSGQAVAFDDAIVSATCSDCNTATLAYYIFVPDNGAENIVGLAVVGGLVSVPSEETKQIPVRFVMENGQLVIPADYGDGFTYTASGAPSGTSVSTTGIVTAGGTAGDFEVAVSYDNDGTTLTTPVNVSVTTT